MQQPSQSLHPHRQIVFIHPSRITPGSQIHMQRSSSLLRLLFFSCQKKKKNLKILTIWFYIASADICVNQCVLHDVSAIATPLCRFPCFRGGVRSHHEKHMLADTNRKHRQMRERRTELLSCHLIFKSLCLNTHQWERNPLQGRQTGKDSGSNDNPFVFSN